MFLLMIKILLFNIAAPVTSSTSSKDLGEPLPKKTRRVLPEHEGKYKIKLPSGSTKRSKEILAKKEKCK